MVPAGAQPKQRQPGVLTSLITPLMAPHETIILDTFRGAPAFFAWWRFSGDPMGSQLGPVDREFLKRGLYGPAGPYCLAFGQFTLIWFKRTARALDFIICNFSHHKTLYFRWIMYLIFFFSFSGIFNSGKAEGRQHKPLEEIRSISWVRNEQLVGWRVVGRFWLIEVHFIIIIGPVLT